MADNEKGIFEKVLKGWVNLNRAPLRAGGASEETVAMMDASAKAYLNGEILKGMELAAKSNAQGLIELHKAAFYAVIDTFAISPPPSNIPSPHKATPQQRARWNMD